MRLLFSEHKSDYANYIFPYAIWAIPEDDEASAKIFARGFLPASRELDRFYMCRHVRVDLSQFSRSSENRRILRKCEGIECRLVARNEFDYTSGWRDFCKQYADIKFGKDVMTFERLDSLFDSKIVSHLLVFTDTKEEKDVGVVTLYLEENALAFYYYCFYDLNYYARNLGMFMMTSAVDNFSRQECAYLYLGSCYSRNALYKTQFAGSQFFNGFKWSSDLKELKYLIERDKGAVTTHLLETKEFTNRYYPMELHDLARETDFALLLE